MDERRQDLRQVCWEHSQRIGEMERLCHLLRNSLTTITKEHDDMNRELYGNDGEGGLTKGLRNVQMEIHDAKIWIKAMFGVLMVLAIVSGSVNAEKLLKLFVK